MWFESWDGDLVFGNESILAYEGCRYRKMRPVKTARYCTHKHIAAGSTNQRTKSTAAKDG
jgi:hypothetical protein